MADESLQISRAPKNGRKSHIPIVLKAAQVIAATFAIGLIAFPFDSFQRIFNRPRVSLHDIAFIYITIGGYMVINLILIICHLIGDRLPKRTSILFASIGCLFHLIAACLIVQNWRKLFGDYAYVHNNAIYPSKTYMDMLISGGVFTFINSGLFAGEVYSTLKYT